MNTRKGYRLATETFIPTNSFYIPVIDRWLDLYWNNGSNRFPEYALTLYWNDTGENYQHKMSYQEVLNVLADLLNPEYAEDTIKYHSVKGEEHGTD